ncbi:DUF4873 domain-containing protein [Nocardiopsis alkaliphila]|uniref:DUF4873 domain-containing protein n=1 Tax=Nocardiopsis alkaliphila TaxID=225762 RepID=UPI000347529C|nr:DUF4873 domain-containing protein [Nocardiopsis alkaliphila]
MSGFDDDEEEYQGTVTVLFSEEATEGVQVRAHLAGHFSPLTGDYRWTGRLAANPDLTKAYEDGARTVVVRTPDGHEGVGALDAPNLWGGHPIKGSGTPPFAVPHIVLEED